MLDCWKASKGAEKMVDTMVANLDLRKAVELAAMLVPPMDSLLVELTVLLLEEETAVRKAL